MNLSPGGSLLVRDQVPVVGYFDYICLNGATMVGLALVCLYGFKSRREFVKFEVQSRR